MKKQSLTVHLLQHLTDMIWPMPGTVARGPGGKRSVALSRPQALDETHFAPILNAPDWKRALVAILTEQDATLPFNYR